MKTEIEIFNPKHIVLFTGENWATEFIKYLKGENNIIETHSWDCYDIKVYSIDGRFFYLTEHPQGKNEEEHSSALIELIRKYS